MKYQTLLIAVIFLIAGGLSAQNECKVLIPALNGEYQGGCKKGLANGYGEAKGVDSYKGKFKKGLPNGLGTYTWHNGGVYEGYWKSGKQNGEGVYKISLQDKDSVADGIWKNGEYIGKKQIKPEVVAKESIMSYNFRREGDGNRITIEFRLNGQMNRELEDLDIAISSGSEFRNGANIGYEDVVFPVYIKVRYMSYNAAHTFLHPVLFEFKIEQAGRWNVLINNQ